MKRFKIELAVYLVLFLLLSCTIHMNACLDEPVSHLKALPQSPLGMLHPFYLTFAAYLVILPFRLAVWKVRKVFRTRKS